MKPVVKRCWHKGCKMVLVVKRGQSENFQWYNGDEVNFKVGRVDWKGTIEIEGNKLDVIINSFAYCSKHPASLLIKEKEKEKKGEGLINK